MTTLAWLLIIAAILLAITLGLAVRRHETHAAPHRRRMLRDDRHLIDLMS